MAVPELGHVLNGASARSQRAIAQRFSAMALSCRSRRRDFVRNWGTFGHHHRQSNGVSNPWLARSAFSALQTSHSERQAKRPTCGSHPSDRADLRPTDRHPNGPRPAFAGLGRADRRAGAIGRDAGRRPAEAQQPPQNRSTYRDKPRSRPRPRASAVMIVRSRTLISMSLPRIFSSSGRHGTSVNA